MNKHKYLHRKGRDDKKWRTHDNRTKKHYGDDAPFHESIRDKHKQESRYFWNWQTGIDFTPVGCYIEENLNRDWDDVYSEIIKKVKPKYRWQLENYLDWCIAKVTWIDHVPYLRHGRIPIEWTLVDEDNILRKYETEKEILDIANKKVRKDKLLKIQEIANEETTI